MARAASAGALTGGSGSGACASASRQSRGGGAPSSASSSSAASVPALATAAASSGVAGRGAQRGGLSAIPNAAANSPRNGLASNLFGAATLVPGSGHAGQGLDELQGSSKSAGTTRTSTPPGTFRSRGVREASAASASAAGGGAREGGCNGGGEGGDPSAGAAAGRSSPDALATADAAAGGAPARLGARSAGGAGDALLSSSKFLLAGGSPEAAMAGADLGTPPCSPLAPEASSGQAASGTSVDAVEASLSLASPGPVTPPPGFVCAGGGVRPAMPSPSRREIVESLRRLQRAQRHQLQALSLDTSSIARSTDTAETTPRRYAGIEHGRRRSTALYNDAAERVHRKREMKSSVEREKRQALEEERRAFAARLSEWQKTYRMRDERTPLERRSDNYLRGKEERARLCEKQQQEREHEELAQCTFRPTLVARRDGASPRVRTASPSPRSAIAASPRSAIAGSPTARQPQRPQQQQLRFGSLSAAATAAAASSLSPSALGLSDLATPRDPKSIAETQASLLRRLQELEEAALHGGDASGGGRDSRTASVSDCGRSSRTLSFAALSPRDALGSARSEQEARDALGGAATASSAAGFDGELYCQKLDLVHALERAEVAALGLCKADREVLTQGGFRFGLGEEVRRTLRPPQALWAGEEDDAAAAAATAPAAATAASSATACSSAAPAQAVGPVAVPTPERQLRAEDVPEAEATLPLASASSPSSSAVPVRRTLSGGGGATAASSEAGLQSPWPTSSRLAEGEASPPSLLDGTPGSCGPIGLPAQTDGDGGSLCPIGSPVSLCASLCAVQVGDVLSRDAEVAGAETATSLSLSFADKVRPESAEAEANDPGRELDAMDVASGARSCGDGLSHFGGNASAELEAVHAEQDAA
eukprot:TRINITY_DN72469_c0_g1_i1.p1 TRINITY_DN72469_c0_g1~~TRINITY_DN72469_c0_g1_i1.p1  ORF type:complete len:900 (+),score=214.19 TRINITY_DN72469_c0_g1_i1:46-2700(+)